MTEFTTGDFVEIICHDGAPFAGWIERVADDYVVLTGPRAFPFEDVRMMTHG